MNRAEVLGVLAIGFFGGLIVGRIYFDDILNAILGPAELIDELLEKPV